MINKTVNEKRKTKLLKKRWNKKEKEEINDKQVNDNNMYSQYEVNYGFQVR